MLALFLRFRRFSVQKQSTFSITPLSFDPLPGIPANMHIKRILRETKVIGLHSGLAADSVGLCGMITSTTL